MVALAFVLHYTCAVTIPFVLAVFIVSLVSPVLDFQVLRLRLPRPIAVLVTCLIVLVIIAVLCFLLTLVIQAIITEVYAYSQDLGNLANRAFQEMGQVAERFNQDKIVSDLQNRIPKLVANTFGAVFNLLSSVFLVLIIVVFLLAGRNPHAVRAGVYADMDSQIRRYIAIKIAVSVLTGVLVWAILGTLELPLAPIFGVLAFVLNFIPSIGSVISTLLPIPVAVAQFQDAPLTIVLVIALPGAIQMAIGNVLEPKLMGEELNLHPVTVLLALSFWGLLWGIPGMFLAAPLTAIIRIILVQFDTLKPIGDLLAGELPETFGSSE
jgi:AI-2 transport protein TqsA